MATARNEALLERINDSKTPKAALVAALAAIVAHIDAQPNGGALDAKYVTLVSIAEKNLA